MKKYVVRLTEEARKELRELVKKGKGPVSRVKHAHLLLAVDADGPAWTDERAAQAYRCHQGTVENVRRHFVERGLVEALERKRQTRPSRRRLMDGEKEAHLIALACSAPPAGRARWTLKLLADRLVVLDVVDSICPETVRQTLKKTNSNRTCGSVG
jgi:hypothetical protein